MTENHTHRDEHSGSTGSEQSSTANESDLSARRGTPTSHDTCNGNETHPKNASLDERESGREKGREGEKYASGIGLLLIMVSLSMCFFAASLDLVSLGHLTFQKPLISDDCRPL